MKSAYPSSQSFFDSTSDSIRTEDVDKCRSNASFSSLSDLFTNPTSKSDLFPNVRAPVFVSEEVHFPAKKKRECEERTSIWHEWGSGECQTENVAQESSGVSSDLLKSSASKSSTLLSSLSSSSSFPNLGSANISLVTEEFSFPARKKREEESSWREERTTRQDWSMSGSSKDNTPAESSTPVGSMTDMYATKSPSGPKSTLFSSVGAPTGSISDELSFPARKKREERSFWQDCSLDCGPSDGQRIAGHRERTSGVSSLADMYLQKPGSKCSNLFPEKIVGNPEEVVFPKRKHRADRNAWRDWSNTGYSDREEDAYQEVVSSDNFARPEFEVLTCSQVASQSYDSPSISEDSSRGSEEFSMTECLPAADCALRSAVHEGDGGAEDSTQWLSSTIRRHPSDADSCLNGGLAGNVDESRSPEFSHSPLANEVERSTGAAETSDAPGRIEGVQTSSRFQSSRSSKRGSRQNGKYPPPLRSLSRQGSLRLPHHMPWVQLQPIRSEGRFMLQEVKVTQPVVFQPFREEGRLVLQLIEQDSGLRDKEAETNFHGVSPVVEVKVAIVPELMVVKEPVLMEVVEKVNQLVERPVQIGRERRKKSSKVWPAIETSEKVDDVDKSVAAGTEAATGLSNRHSVNSLQLSSRMGKSFSPYEITVSEPERAFILEGGFMEDSPLPWLLSKVAPEDAKFDARSWLHPRLHPEVRFRERFPLSTSETAEHLVPKGNIITVRRARENSPLRVPFQTLSRSRSLRNGVSGLNCSLVEGGANLIKGGNITISTHGDFTATESVKDERSSSDSVEGRPPEDERPSLSGCQGIIRDSVLSLTTAHSQSFLRYLRMRSDLPGEPDPRLSNYAAPLVVAAFSCAEVIGKRHHEKNFWEQQACVS